MTEMPSPQPAPSEPVTPELIAEHVRNKEIEIWLKSRALAGALLGVAVGLLAYNHDFAPFGPYSHFMAGAVAFVIGWKMGDRAVFAIFGGAVVYFFMRQGQ